MPSAFDAAQFGDGTGGVGIASTSISIGSPVTVGSWTFLSNSQSYTVTGSAAIDFNAGGVTNNANVNQFISIDSNMSGVGATLTQAGASTHGHIRHEQLRQFRSSRPARSSTPARSHRPLRS